MLMRRSRLSSILLILFISFIASVASAEPWSFGVLADTQWRPGSPENRTVAVNIVDAVNRRFIAAKVDLVLQVGDLTDDGSDAALDMRASHNRALAEAHIPFYPLRGNHEASVRAAAHFGAAFPKLPGTPGNGGSSPSLPGASGHTYSFVHKGAKFVLLDQFTLADGSKTGRAYTMGDFQPWIDRELAAKDHQHALVLAHKDLIGRNHSDNLFGDGDEHPEMQNAFFASLERNGVRFFLCGHDHMHYRSLVTSIDGRSALQQIIGASASYKCYVPERNSPARNQPLAEELKRIGYYVYTVDGPRVTGRYYSTAIFGSAPADPKWELRETYGYSLNGKSFLVKRGESYTRVADSVAAGNAFVGTTMSILSGKNHIGEKAYRDGRPAKLVTTGWSPKDEPMLVSDVLTLWGMAGKLGSSETDTYTLLMSFDRGGRTDDQLRAVAFGVITRDAAGKWRLAASQNQGGTKRLVFGPWDESYTLGTYGIDVKTNTAWAIVNRAGEFAVGQIPE